MTPLVQRAQRAEADARSAAAGLVSVPTSGHATASLSDAVAAATQDAMRAVGAFALDAGRRRLAMLRRSVGFAARAHGVSERGRRDDDVLMVTLTYRDADAWTPRHVSDYLRELRRWMQARGLPCRYVWVAEMQRRGAIHYHIALWVPAGRKVPMPDRSGMWPWGMTQLVKARAAVPYLLKYLSKGTDLAYPKGARAHGAGGLDESLRRAKSWLSRPAAVRGNGSIDDRWRPAPGGGWAGPDGSVLSSEWRRVLVAGMQCVQRVARHALAIEASGPFSWVVR